MAGEFDIVGEDFVGEDYVGGQYEIVGAPPPRQAPMRRGSPVAGLPPGQRVMRSEDDIARRQIAPIPLTTIAAGATETVEFRPQRPIRIERIVLDGATVAGLFVTDVMIGAETQFVNNGAVPVSCFQPNAFGTSLRGNTAQPGISVTLRIYNSTNVSLTLGGAVIGTSLT